MIELEIPARMPWVEEAACLSSSPDVFFVERGAREAEAKRICASCPVLGPCREWGIDHELFGVWGGLSPWERAQVRRRRGVRVLTCKECGRLFMVRLTRGTPIGYCSSGCRHAARNRQKRESWQRRKAG